MPDPAEVDGSAAEKAAAFAETYRLLDRRIGLFLALPLDTLDRMSALSRVRAIGRTADAAGTGSKA